MKKNIYFHTINLYSEDTKREQDFRLIRDLFKGAISTNSRSNALILSEGENRVTMDVLINTNEYLFVKLGKIKENSALQFRNFETLESSEVISDEESDKKGLEIYTYCLIDFNFSIMSIMLGQAAPGANSINNILERYNEAYYTQIAEIASLESVKALFSPGSVLNHIEYEVAVPSAEALGDQLLGLNRNQVRQLSDATTKKVRIAIKNDDRKFLSNAHDVIKNIIESFGSRREDYSNLSFNGRTRGSSSKNYSFDDRIYNDRIDISTFKTENGQKVKLESHELEDEYFSKMKGSYIHHKRQLLTLSGRYDETVES